MTMKMHPKHAGSHQTVITRDLCAFVNEVHAGWKFHTVFVFGDYLLICGNDTICLCHETKQRGLYEPATSIS